MPAPPREGEMVTAEHEGSVVAVARVEGTLHAFDDTCPHAGCSLAEGELDGRTVVCPCHMATFDVTTGAVVDGPAASGVTTWSVTATESGLTFGGSRDQPPARADAGGREDGGPSSAAAPDTDVAVLVEREHGAMRRQFEALDQLTGTQELAAAWAALRELLEVHASAEESLLYPGLAGAAHEGEQEARHAVRDHNRIRDAVRAVQEHEVGSEEWRRELDGVREANEEHLQEEERGPLPLFRETTGREHREELGRRWLDFCEQHRHARGLAGEDVDPGSVVEGGS